MFYTPIQFQVAGVDSFATAARQSWPPTHTSLKGIFHFGRVWWS